MNWIRPAVIVVWCCFAAAILMTADVPVDSYVAEYLQNCLLEHRCPSVDCIGPCPAAFPILPRQVEVRDGGSTIVIAPPTTLPITSVEDYYRARRIRPLPAITGDTETR